MRLLAFAVLLIGTVIGAPDALAGVPAAKSAKRAPAEFLGLDPHGPLARVRAGAVVPPEDGACRSWGNDDGPWKALDRFGKIVGTASVTGLDRYDVTNCDELTLARVTGKKGVGLFARGSYAPLAIKPWKPVAAARRSLERLVAKRDGRLPTPSSKKKDLPIAKRMLAFRAPGQAPRVIVGGRAMSVYRLERGKWTLEFEELPCAEGELRSKACQDTVWDVGMYKPVGVLDMNADGLPEIVVHQAWMDAYGDVTLTPAKKGRWKQVESAIHGGFA